MPVMRDYPRWSRLFSIVTSDFGERPAVDVLTFTVAAGTLTVLILTARFLREQTRISREIGQRGHHLELVRLGLEHPRLLSTVVPDKAGAIERLTADMYRNLWFMHYQMGFITQGMTEDEIREYLARTIFVNDAALVWWSEMEDLGRGASTESRRFRRFLAIANEVAVRAGFDLQSKSSGAS